MAHFAELDPANLVLRVIVVPDEVEATGEAWCANLLGGRWKQTSYNTRGGAHQRGGKPFRKNYAGIGYTYDAQRDAFIPPKPTPEAVFDEPSCTWRVPGAPVTE
jgi:hypothetical protein